MLSGMEDQSSFAAQRTRRARSAMDLLAARMEARISSVISTAKPFTMALVQRFNTSSGAPLVYWMMVPSAALWTVDIIFRMESKGASPTRGHAAFSSGFKRPFLAASLTRAHSVGSPMAWPASASIRNRNGGPWLFPVPFHRQSHGPPRSSGSGSAYQSYQSR